MPYELIAGSGTTSGMNRYALTHPSHTKDTLLGVGSLDPIRSFPIPMRDKEGNTAI